jgi:aminopeptidase N
MPGLNLTQTEAAERGRALHVDGYDIDLDFSARGDVFDSITVVRFSASEPGGSTFMDLVADRVRSVTLNGVALDPAAVYADGRIALDRLAADNEVRIEADCAYSNSGQGLHRTIDPADGRTYLYTHFEVPDARRLYATFEQPDLKASFRFTVTAPTGWTVLSNSPTPAPAVSGPVSTWAFAPTKRISTYITAVIAGEYHIVHDTHTTADGTVIPMAVACRQSVAAHLDAANVLEITKKGFDYYIETFGRAYPFEKYDQVFVPEYNIGAMENVGLVTIVERYVFESKPTTADIERRANTILHELAHMWFGDLVTMRWWDDLWLKESFATYCAYRCLSEVSEWPVWTDFIASKTWGLRQDELPSTHPIVADIRDLQDVSVNFDGITYAKGAAVLKQLVAWVGADEFFAGAKLYFDTYEWGNTTLGDLLGALEKTSGRDLATWSALWLQTSGPNTLTPSFTLDADGAYASFDVLQTAPAAHPTLRPHRISIGLYTRSGRQLIRTSQVTLDIAGASTAVPELVGRAQPDLLLLNDDDLTYAKIRLDDRSMATLVSHIGGFTDPLARALCWSAAWDMVRNAEMPARDFIALVLAGIDAETTISVVEDLLVRVLATVQHFVAPADRDAIRTRVADAARDHLLAAEPGSDPQLAWARLFIRLAGTDADIATIAGMLDGSHPIHGLDLDFSLRWSIVGTLAAAGRFDATQIEAQVAQDRTTAAHAFAIGALAARPTAAAKADAWQRALGDDALTKSALDALGGIREAGRSGLGFGQPGQDDLLAPYVDRYFAALPDVWAERTAEVARSFIDGFYPAGLASPRLIAQTDAYLATAAPAPAPALRRMLLENRDDVVRALAAQALDAAGAATGSNAGSR